MGDGLRNPGCERAAAVLRERILAMPADTRLGSEERLLDDLGVSRSTLRQVARILEGEGLLKVRRGKNGGYFAARPDLSTVQAAVSGYLRTLGVPSHDATMIASVLWVETIRRAAGVDHGARVRLAEDFRARLTDLSPHATFNEVLAIEQAFRSAIFDLVDSRYVQLIFQINSAFAVGNFRPGSDEDGTSRQEEFVNAWRTARLLELATLEGGDGDLAALAARRSREIWNERVGLPPWWRGSGEPQ
jgi:DNA-binding GntR family transcriptional regulator